VPVAVVLGSVVVEDAEPPRSRDVHAHTTTSVAIAGHRWNRPRGIGIDLLARSRTIVYTDGIE
jgi:hypothetical protein